MRCLSKSPADRPSASEAVDQLDDVALAVGISSGAISHSTPASTSAALPSIAVLPFTNRTGDPDNDYLADGIAEEILNSLARLRTMHVAARSSSFAFRGSGIDVRAAGERLGVRSVLEGSVRKSGNRLRVTVQLVDVASGFQLWSERYDRETSDVFEVEDEIAAKVVDTLQVTLLPAGECAGSSSPPDESRGVRAVPARPVHVESGWGGNRAVARAVREGTRARSRVRAGARRRRRRLHCRRALRAHAAGGGVSARARSRRACARPR
jgi:TolB-like protein